jgi:uncharacterized protein (DUF58 family)
METSELLKKVRKIEIKTRGLSNQVFSGEYHSAFKGRGMTFSEVREYQYGDEIREIDWNVTARFNHPYVKIFEEERELTMMLMVDVSASESFGTQKQYKKDLLTELSAVLAFAAIQNNDKIGVIFFSDKIEKFIPPKKGKKHVLRIIREMIEFEPENKKTDIKMALEYMINVMKKRAIVFVLSDFLDSNYEEAMKIATRKHDTIAIQVYDKSESGLPNMGLVHILDPESGQKSWLDTSSSEVRRKYAAWWNQKQQEIEKLLLRSKVDQVKIATDQSYVSPLMNFFKHRGSRK